MMKYLNELRDRAYKTSCEHGFHDEEHSNEHLLCLVVSELMEAVQADRKGKMADKTAFEKAINSFFNEKSENVIFKVEYERYIKGSVEEELADACIRLLDIAGLRKHNIRLEEYPDIVYRNSTFTENVYYITRFIVNECYNIGVKPSFAISNIFALADILNIDLMWHIETKMRYNELREYKHGCKY